MAFHPLTLLKAQRGRGEQCSLPKGCKRTCWWRFQVTSCKGTFVISQLQSMFRALAIQTCCDMGNKKSGSRTPMICLLTLPRNATQDVGAVNAGTFSIIHCPTVRDKGDIKFFLWRWPGATPLILQNSSNTPEEEKICVSMVVSAPQPSPSSQNKLSHP